MTISRIWLITKGKTGEVGFAIGRSSFNFGILWQGWLVQISMKIQKSPAAFFAACCFHPGSFSKAGWSILNTFSKSVSERYS